MTNRSYLPVVYSPIDKFLDILTWVVVIIKWGYVSYFYSIIPSQIPIHFNSVGQADAYGNKVNLWILILVSTVLCIAMTVLNRYPHLFNYPTKVTEEHKHKLYAYATRMIRWLRLNVCCIFGYIIYQTIAIAQGEIMEESLGLWLLPVFLFMIAFPIGYFIIKSSNTTS
jgi:uncharacterized membrane protein